jgi:arginine N-succinyltransferase
LSLARFLFMAEHRWSFDETVIAEMRGVIDAAGRSPFWDAVGRHFFEIEFPNADYLSLLNKRFIADLMPHHPVSIPLLPPAAQAVIGQVHPDTRPALAILEQEGFAFTGMVDIFEAGPIVSCPRDRIRLVRESRSLPVAALTDAAADTTGGDWIVAGWRDGFRACRSAVELPPAGGVGLPRDTARALGVRVGDTVRIGRLRATAEPEQPLEAAP